MKRTNIFKPPKKNIPEIKITNEHFPELSTTSAKDKTSQMNFMVKLNKTTEIPEEYCGLKPGYIMIRYDTNKKLVVETSKIQNISNTHTHTYIKPVNFKKMVDHWDNYYNLYDEIYGKDIYAKYHLFPNYNYNYFDILDDKFYLELDAEETQTEHNYESVEPDEYDV
jgi:hypothetical protein